MKDEVKDEVKEEAGAAGDAEGDVGSTAAAGLAAGAAAVPSSVIGGAPAQGAPPGPATHQAGQNPLQAIAGLNASAARLPAAGTPSALGGGLMLQPPSMAQERPPVLASEPSPLLTQQQGPLAGNLPAGPPGAPPPGPSQPYRQLKVEDALAYLDKVKMKFDKQPHIYNQVRSCGLLARCLAN